MALAIEYGIEVIEDACQAHLARFDGKAVGQFGRFGAFSFYPGKNLGAYGEAGALITQDEKLYIKAKMLRQHGEIKRYQHELVGHNYRMSAIQGAVLSTKLQYLPQWTIKRQAVAQRYNEILSEIENLLLPAEYAGAESVYHLFVIQTDYRDELRQYLSKCGIDTGIHYPLALHQQTAYKYLGYKENDFPMARTAVEKILSLPMYPELSEQQILYVCNKIKSFYKEWNQ
jgi:dTDP-4-amino-4,6-dideoxygalactose transaminase